MKFIFDENLSKGLAMGLRDFGEDVDHITEHFPRGTPDDILLKFIGENGYFLVTKDDRIRYNPLEIKALKEYDVGAFILTGKNTGRWNIVKQVVRSWEEIKETAEKEKTPFVYKVSQFGKIERVPLS